MNNDRRIYPYWILYILGVALMCAGLLWYPYTQAHTYLSKQLLKIGLEFTLSLSTGLVLGMIFITYIRSKSKK